MLAKTNVLLCKQLFITAFVYFSNAKEIISQDLHQDKSVRELANILNDDPKVVVDNLFSGEALYSGAWKSESVKKVSFATDLQNIDDFKSDNLQGQSFESTPFDGKFNENKGDSDVVFFKHDGLIRFMQLHFIDGFYVDQQQVFVRVDLANSYHANNSSFYYEGDFNYTRIMQFNNILKSDKCATVMNMMLKDKNTGENWDITQKDHENLKVTYNLVSQKPCDFNINGESVIQGEQLLMPLVYLGCVALASLMNIASVYFQVKDTHYYFFYKVEPYSQAIQMILDFQFFGFNMFQGLSIASAYFEYLTMASIGLFFGCLVKMRLAFMAVQFQNANNENLNQRNCSNPVMNFAVKVLVSMSVFYIASFFIMINWWYSYYLIPFYLFPVLQIWKAAKLGTRKVFKWQFQLLLWPQSLIIPIFLKGYDNNFIKLTPNVLVHSIIVPSMIGFFLQYSMMQHVFGPRFCFLACFFPAPHKYQLPIKNLAKEKSDDEEALMCPICYGEQDSDPTYAARETFTHESSDAVANNSGARQEPQLRAKPQKKCMMTPCKHYYHPSCLKQWMDQKMECPTCRTELPPY